MRSYEAARLYFGILEFIGWCVIIGGIIFFFVGLSTGSQVNLYGNRSGGMAFIGAVPGLAIMFLGFLGLVFAQIGRAGVDSAEYAQQSLKIAREQLDISKQALKQGATPDAGFAALQAAKDDLRSGQEPAVPVPKPSFADVKPADEAKTEVAPQPSETIEYRGKSIRVVEGGYDFGGTIFETLEKAKARVEEVTYSQKIEPGPPQPYSDQLGVNPGVSLKRPTRL